MKSNNPVNFRQARSSGVTNCDVYYIPPQDGRYRTREAKRKRRSKKDQERYFEDFPDDDLSIKNFNYVKKPLGLNNAAYEMVRQAKLKDACKLFIFSCQGTVQPGESGIWQEILPIFCHSTMR